MADQMEIEGNTYDITGYAEDGLPILRGVATSTQDGFDEAGNPTISVHINVPAVTIGVTPGEIN